MTAPEGEPRPLRPGFLLPRLPLQAWLAISHLVVLVLPALVVLLSGALGADLRQQTRWDLEHQGALLVMLARSEVMRARLTDPEADLATLAEPLTAALQQAKAETRSGLQITDETGRVVATSGTVLDGDLSDDPVVAAALEGRRTTDVRPRPPPTAAPLSSESRRARVRLFVALPIELDGRILGALVLSRTPREEVQALYQMAPAARGASLAALLITLAVAATAGVVLTRSLSMLDRGARRLAEGSSVGLEELGRPRASHLSEVAWLAVSVTAMAERMRERLAYITEFASNVSHEFKTPIATLRGTVELLQDDDAMPREQRDRFLGNAARELDRLERLVNGLLTLARAEQGPPDQPVALGQVLGEVAGRLGVPFEGEAGEVTGDRAQLEAIVSNLVQNALRHGGDGVTVRLVGFVDGGSTGFRVEDDGTGISEANLPRVFDRFFTTDRAGGTGLGLALVRTVARRHGGDVSVESRPGRTVFTVRLPARG